MNGRTGADLCTRFGVRKNRANSRFNYPHKKVCLRMFSGTETRPVEVVVELPLELVDDVQAANDADPDFFGRAIQYALARRIIFEELATAGSDAS